MPVLSLKALSAVSILKDKEPNKELIMNLPPELKTYIYIFHKYQNHAKDLFYSAKIKADRIDDSMHLDLINLTYKQMIKHKNLLSKHLLRAAECDHPNTVLALLERHADIDMKAYVSLRTPLMNTAECGYIDTALVLIENGAKLDMKDDYGSTALILAAINGRTNIAIALIKKGANINMKDNNGCTALWWAARNGHIDIVKALIEKDADTDVKDHDLGRNALMQAQAKGHTDIVKILMKTSL